LCDDRPTASEQTKDIDDLFNDLERVKKTASQDLVERCSTQALRTYCNLNYQTVYDGRIISLQFPIGNRNYSMPKIGCQTTFAKEFTLGRVRISTVYLPQVQGEENCVYAREMFCLIAIAGNSARARVEDHYPVGTPLKDL
jgi:hypothetical protein